MPIYAVGYREALNQTASRRKGTHTNYSYINLTVVEKMVILTHPSDTTQDFSLLIKPTGAECNLACRYCFYLDKKGLYPGSTLRMNIKVLEVAIQQRLSTPRKGEITIAWQGGEPTLMGLDFFQHSLELVKRYKKPGQRVSYSIQTNGTLLDKAWCVFFKKHNFLVGLSMDGTAEDHNTYRVDKGGKGSFDRVRHAWELLQEYKVDTNILCAVHSVNAPKPFETYHFFRDVLRARFIQFIPIVEQKEESKLPGLESDSNQSADEYGSTHSPRVKVSSHSVKPEQYGRFLTEIFDEWVRHDVGKVFIQNFEAALASWCHLPANVCVFQQVCGSSLILEHNGDLYSCDHFVDPEHRLGNILEQPMITLARSDHQRQFGLDKREQLPVDCRECDVLFACRGGCPRNRFTSTGDGEFRINYLCPSYKLFFHHIDRPMHHMAVLLQHGHSASEIMNEEN